MNRFRTLLLTGHSGNGDEDDLLFVVSRDGNMLARRVTEPIIDDSVDVYRSIQLNSVYRMPFLVVVSICMPVMGKVCVSARSAAECMFTPQQLEDRSIVVHVCLEDLFPDGFQLTPTQNTLCIEVAPLSTCVRSNKVGGQFEPLSAECVFEGSVAVEDLVPLLPRWRPIGGRRAKVVEMLGPSRRGSLSASVQGTEERVAVVLQELSMRDWQAIKTGPEHGI